MQRSVKVALVAVVAVIVLGSVGFWYFVLRDTAPAPVTLRSRDDSSASTAGGGPTTADGNWKVANGDESVFVGYRILELFGGDTVKKEAVGRTTAVSGTMTIAGTQVTAVDISADVTSLKSDRPQRDGQVTRALETARFGTATFKLTQPIVLPSAPQKGQAVNASATGELTLHGQTRSVTVPLEARWNGPTIDVSGKADVKLADYQITRPQVPGIAVDEQGQLELSLTFVPG